MSILLSSAIKEKKGVNLSYNNNYTAIIIIQLLPVMMEKCIYGIIKMAV